MLFVSLYQKYELLNEFFLVETSSASTETTHLFLVKIDVLRSVHTALAIAMLLAMQKIHR